MRGKEGDFEGTLTSQWYPLVSKELFVLYVEALPVCGEGMHTSVYFRDHFQAIYRRVFPEMQLVVKCFPRVDVCRALGRGEKGRL